MAGIKCGVIESDTMNRESECQKNEQMNQIVIVDLIVGRMYNLCVCLCLVHCAMSTTLMNNLLFKLSKQLVVSLRKHFIFNHTLNDTTFIKLKNEHAQNTEKWSIYLNKTL